MSLYGASTPVLEVGCSRRISLFKYIYSLQGCNYFDISVSASQSHNAELVMQQPLPERWVLTSDKGCWRDHPEDLELKKESSPKRKYEQTFYPAVVWLFCPRVNKTSQNISHVMRQKARSRKLVSDQWRGPKINMTTQNYFTFFITHALKADMLKKL